MRENLMSGSMRGGWKRGRRALGTRRWEAAPRKSSRSRPSYRASRLLHPQGETSHVRKKSSRGLQERPGHLLSVELTMIKATVEDADEAVGEGAQRLGMSLAPSPELFVVALGSG